MIDAIKALRTPNISVGLAHAGAWFKSWDVHTAHILSANANAQFLALATDILILSASGMILVGVNVLIATFAENENGNPHAWTAAFKLLFAVSSLLLLGGFALCIKVLLGY